MGKYMRKAKTAADVALMEVARSSLGVRTRARTLALQRLQQPPPPPSTAASGGSYLQLRSRRLEKPPIDHSKRHKQLQQKQSPKQAPALSPSPNSRKSRLEFLNGEGGDLGIEKLEEGLQETKNSDLGGGVEASCGENVLEFEGRERSTRESTPCSLIRDPESIRTPGSTTSPTCSAMANGGVQSSMPSHIPTAQEMDNFFSGPEEEQQKQFMDKYNFDPVKDKPLPGRFEWEKLNP